MLHQLLDTMRQQADMAGGARAMVRHGIVSGYDPGSYCAKVRVMPEDRETGWLPIVSPWIGNGWGLFAPPSIGDAVEVQFQEDDAEAGYVCQRFYNDTDRPLSVESGEFWLVHKSGSLLKFHNSGDVELVTNRDLNATVARNATVAVAGNITSNASRWDHTGPVNITGNVVINGTERVTGMITGQGGMGISGGTGGASATITGNVQINGTTTTTGDVVAGGISLDNHTHSGVYPGSGSTGGPQ